MREFMLVWPAAVLAVFMLAALLVSIFKAKLARDDAKDYPGPERTPRLKIPADCPKTDFDFIVDLECPDGSIARVLIPIDPHPWEGRGSRTLDNDARPVGLDLAYPGHYN